jgi:hypothetical protein
MDGENPVEKLLSANFIVPGDNVKLCNTPKGGFVAKNL